MLQYGTNLAAGGINDVAEAVLVLVRLPGDQTSAEQKVVGLGKVVEIDGDVMSVVGGDGLLRLPKAHLLVTADGDYRLRRVVLFDYSWTTHDRGVEGGNSRRAARGHVDLDVGNPDGDAGDLVRSVQAERVAPRPGDDQLTIDLVVRYLRLGHKGDSVDESVEALDDGRRVRDDQADAAPKALGFGRQDQVHLLTAEVDPGGSEEAEIDVGVSGETEARYVETFGQIPVDDGQVHVLESQYVSDILAGAVVVGGALGGVMALCVRHG